MSQSTLVTAREIIERTNARISSMGINPKPEKYKHLVLQEAEKHNLSEQQTKELARHLGIPWSSAPWFAEHWKPSLCKFYSSIKYSNPGNHQEFIVIVSSKSVFGIKAVLHHTPNGYLNKSWFTNFVPDLDHFAKNYEMAINGIPVSLNDKQRENQVRKAFTSNINDQINPQFPNGLTIEQIRVTNAFFFKYLPDVEGLCSSCFRLSLPHSGPGVRWFSPSNHLCEVRLSEPKPNGFQNQQKLYLTHNYQVNAETLHVKWNGIVSEVPTLDLNVRQLETHIPWENYDYQHIVDHLPEHKGHKFLVCQCKKI